MAIPFFIAAGIFMGAGGLSHRLLALADEVVGGLSGGIALASIATCMFFAAISGSGPATVAAMEEYAREQGYGPDFSQGRFHHEIYLSDVRRCQPEKMKTVIRQPVKKSDID